jgi:hypothetical protein
VNATGPPTRSRDRWDTIERVVRLIVLLITAIAALVAVLHGLGPT